MSEEEQCTVCKAMVPRERVFLLEGRAVCVACKPIVLERLLSGEQRPMEPAALDRDDFSFWTMIKLVGTVLRSHGWRIAVTTAAISLLGSGVFMLLPLPVPTNRAERYQVLGAGILIGILVGSIVPLVITWLVRERLEGRHTTLRQALLHAVRRWPAIVGCKFLALLIIGFLLCLCVIPGLICMVYYAFYFHAASLRNFSGMAALQRSTELVSGRWWRVLGYSVTLSSPLFVWAFGMRWLSVIWPDFDPSYWVADLLLDFLRTIPMLGLTVFYLHLEARRGGWHRTVPAPSPVRPVGPNLPPPAAA